MRASSDPAARRRLTALSVVAGLAAVLGAIAGAGSDDHAARRTPPPAASRAAVGAHDTTAPARAAVDRLPLERQVGQVVMLRFEGSALPAYAQRVFARSAAAGAILFADNVVSPPQLRSLTRVVQRAADGGALLGVDQEGGAVRTIKWAGPDASAPAQGDPSAIRAATRAAGEKLRQAGINVDFAPVADVPSVPRAALSGRSYSNDPATAARAVDAAVRGYAEGGVAATAKHFPGLGGASANTDEQPVTIARPAADLERDDLVPFVAATRAGVPLVMVGHAVYPGEDPVHIASQSPRIYELLRQRVGFGGVAVTDSLEARAVIARSSVDTAALASLRAGADLLLTTGRGSYIHVYRRLLREARESPDLRARIREAAGRVLALKERLRLAVPRG